MTKAKVSLLGVICLLCCWAVPAQAGGDYTLTISTVIPRFGESPFATEDWLVEIQTLGISNGTSQTALPLWGANALAYPLAVKYPRWSLREDWLALVMLERDGREQLAAYGVDSQTLEIIIPPDAGYAAISGVSWRRDLALLYVSAVSPEGQTQLLAIELATYTRTVLVEGSLPALSPDETQLAFLDAKHQLNFLKVADQSISVIGGIYPDATSLVWSPDGGMLALTQGATLLTLDPASGKATTLLVAFDVLDVPTDTIVTVDSAAWSPDNQEVAFVLNVEGEVALSQVVGVTLADQTVTVYAERRYDPAQPFPSDPHRYLGVTYQSSGAFVPVTDNQSGA